LATVLLGKPPHTTRAPTSRMAMKTRRSKHDSYMSLQGDDQRGGLRPHLAGLLWRLRDPPPTSTAWVVRAETTTRTRVAAGAGAPTEGGLNASAGTSGVPIGVAAIHIHSTSEGETRGSDTIPANWWHAGGGCSALKGEARRLPLGSSCRFPQSLAPRAAPLGWGKGTPSSGW
jgi:hypothetical protein